MTTFFDPEYKGIIMGECCICDEPFERGITCQSCDRPVCVACIALHNVTARQMCPECPGAVCWIERGPA